MKRIKMVIAALLIISSVMSVGTANAEKNKEFSNIDQISGVTIPTPPLDLKNILKDSTPESNIFNPKSQYYSKAQSLRSELPKKTSANYITPGDGYLTLIYPKNGRISGISAVQQIHPKLTLDKSPPEMVLYAPTMKEPNSPLEITTIYSNYLEPLDDDGMFRAIGIWDFNYGTFQVLKFMTDENMEKYTMGKEPNVYYMPSITKIDDRWYAMLFNFETRKWEVQYDTYNPQDKLDSREWIFVYGWNFFETYFPDNMCPSLPKIDSMNLQVYDNGGYDLVNGIYTYTVPGWYFVTPEYSEVSGNNFCSSAYNKIMLIPNWYWTVGPYYSSVNKQIYQTNEIVKSLSSKQKN